MYTINKLTSLEQFAGIREEWNELWYNSSTRTPYQTWEWNYFWTKSNRQEGSLNMLTARGSDSTLVGIAPLRYASYLGVKLITFIGQEASIYPDFLIKKGLSFDVLRLFFDQLNSYSRVDAYDFVIAEPSSSIQIIVNDLNKADWMKVNADAYTKRLIVNIGDRYEDYLAGLSKKMRQEIVAESRKLHKQFRVEFLCNESDSDFKNHMVSLLRLNALRWGGDPESSHLSRRECYRAFNAIGCIKVFVLTCDRKPVGALSTLLAGDTLFAEIAGFDYSSAKVDLGKVFYNHLFQWAVEHGFKKIDFSSGEEAYKFRYNPEILTKWRIQAYRTKRAFVWLMHRQNFLRSIAALKRRITENKAYRRMGLHSAYRALKRRFYSN